MLLLVGVLFPAASYADDPDPTDPRARPRPRLHSLDRGRQQRRPAWTTTRGRSAFNTPPIGFTGIATANSDLAFTGDHAVVGSFNGFQIYDLSDPTDPVLRTSFVCPGGQGDPSVYGDLLFISVEETRGRIDCGTQGFPAGHHCQPRPLPRGADL